MARSVFDHLILPHFQHTEQSEFSQRHLKRWSASSNRPLDTRASLGDATYVRCRFNFRDCQVLLADTAEQTDYDEDYVGIAWVSEHAIYDRRGYLTTLLNADLQNGAYDYYPSKYHSPRRYMFMPKCRDEPRNFEEVQSTCASSSSGMLGRLPPHLKDLIISYLFDEFFTLARPTILNKRTQIARDRLRWDVGLETGAIDVDHHKKILALNTSMKRISYEPYCSLATNLSSSCRMLNCDVKSYWLKHNLFMFRSPEQLHRFVDSILPGLTLLERWPHIVVKHVILDLSSMLDAISLDRGTIVASLDQQRGMLVITTDESPQDDQRDAAILQNLCLPSSVGWCAQLNESRSVAVPETLPTPISSASSVPALANLAIARQTQIAPPVPPSQLTWLNPGATSFAQAGQGAQLIIPAVPRTRGGVRNPVQRHLAVTPASAYARRRFLVHASQQAGLIPPLLTATISNASATATLNEPSSVNDNTRSHPISIRQPPFSIRVESGNLNCYKTFWLHEVVNVLGRARYNVKRWPISHIRDGRYGKESSRPGKKSELHRSSRDEQLTWIGDSDDNRVSDLQRPASLLAHTARRQYLATYANLSPGALAAASTRDDAHDLETEQTKADNDHEMRSIRMKNWAKAIDYLLDTFVTRRIDVIFDTQISDEERTGVAREADQIAKQRNIAIFENLGKDSKEKGEFERSRLHEVVKKCILGGHIAGDSVQTGGFTQTR